MSRYRLRTCSAFAFGTRLASGEPAREFAGAAIALNQYLDRWLELAARPKLRAKSFADYQSLLGRYIRPILGERSLSDLAPLDLQSLYHGMQEWQLAPRTIQYTHSVLHSALEQAVRWRLIDSNPASGIELPKPRRAEMRVMQPDEARRFLLYATGKPYGALFALALTTGMRPSEYLALLWSDIDWQKEIVTVMRTLKKGRGWSYAPTKRTRSRRVVKLARWVVDQLRELCQLEVAQSGLIPMAAQPIFHSCSGRPINSDYLARLFKQRLREAGLPAMRLYDLRHTAATLALSAGVPATVISEQLGHATTAFTLDV